jgi:tight adherence protein B
MSEQAASTWLVVGIAVGIAAVLLFTQFLYWSIQTRREEQARELARRIGTLTDKEVAPLLRQRATGAAGIAASLDSLLKQAGAPYTIDALFRRMGGVGGVGALVALFTGKLLLVPLGALLGLVPLLLLSMEADKRASRIAEQLPDGLDLLARSLAAGHGISEGMRMVAEEMPQPIAGEFGRVYEEHNLGREFRECMNGLTDRNPRSFDLRIFVSAVLLQRDTGGNMIEILHGLANTIRQRFVFFGKVRSLTAEARFTAGILVALPFLVSTAILVLSPNYLKPLVTDPLGKAMLIFIVCWFSLGIFTMYETSKVDV